MNSRALSVTHLAEDEQESPIRINFPEPQFNEQAIVQKSGNNGKSWQKMHMGVMGAGRYLSYRIYDIKDTTLFTTKVSEPVICLRVYWGNGSKIRYLHLDNSNLIDDTHNFLFWQGNATVQEELISGEYAHLDIFFRPESLKYLAHYPIINQLLEQTSSQTHGNIDQLKIAESEQLETIITNVLEEIDLNKITAGRFAYLCDCLLLLAIGENITITPPEVELRIANNLSEEPIFYKPKPAEQKVLDELKNMERSTLLVIFHHLFETVAEKQKLQEMEIQLHKTVKEHAAKIWGNEKEALMYLYLGVTGIFEDEYDSGALTDDEKTLLKKAIVKTLDLSFELKDATIQDMEYYMKWSENTPKIKELDELQIKDFLNMLIPDNTIDFNTDPSQRGNILLLEQIKDAFGIRPMSDIMGIEAKDKPKEIVELHKRLMDHCADTLELDSETGVKRSDIIREIDSAYEYDDFVRLLQIELEQLYDKLEYIEQQDDEKLKWLIVALKRANEESDQFFEELKMGRKYQGLQQFHSLGNNLTTFKKEIKNQVNKTHKIGLALSKEIRKVISGNGVRKHIIELAQYILKYEGGG
ncbi:hypothetical protein I6I98_11770 [Sphingobacterium multivorum]|uniref:TerB-C domain-containing protein n=1 Tax=Sphingobacterium multivorum TaxID=28454 RepID=A0ABX7CXQ1_SPHMU|nr:hypothetical protein [Sphingobacterium multivorum]QQT55889.1 hypothetical protein I6I98_11770 [Sphingobacterium multivorum]